MAVGDIRGGIITLPGNGSVDIRPPTEEEWVIHIIGGNGIGEIVYTDGTDEVVVDSYAGFAHKGVFYHVSNSLWIRIKNKSENDSKVLYVGVQTK